MRYAFNFTNFIAKLLNVIMVLIKSSKEYIKHINC